MLACVVAEKHPEAGQMRLITKTSCVLFFGLGLMVPNPVKVIDFPATSLPLAGSLSPFFGFFTASACTVTLNQLLVSKESQDVENWLKSWSCVEPSHQLDTHLLSLLQWPTARSKSYNFATMKESKLRSSFGSGHSGLTSDFRVDGITFIGETWHDGSPGQARTK